LVGPVDPAGAAKLFTIDANGDDYNQIDGRDDLPFSFLGSLGYAATGEIRAVDITQIDKVALAAQVEQYVDFSTGNPVPIPVDDLFFTNFDVLIVDVVLSAGSHPVDEIGIGVGTEPPGIDPLGAGFFIDCASGSQVGCDGLDRPPVGSFPVGGETPYNPTDISLQPGNVFFPGGALFEFDKLGDPANGNMLDGGEVTRRLFVAWTDTGPDSPLSKIDQVAKFMISAGTNQDFYVEIVPEPGTAVLMALGVALLAAARRRAIR
jgi:hypothetical protein